MPIRTRSSTPSAHSTLDGDSRIERGGGSLERGEELVAASVDLAAASSLHSWPQQTAKLVQHGAITISEPVKQLGRALDIGQREGDLTARQLLLRPELDPDESERHDPELLRRLQEPHSRSVAARLILEADAAEPGERVANVRLIVDRQHPPALGVDVRKGAVRQACSLPRAEWWHLPMIVRSLGWR
jgi:hypothetical protein